MDFTATSEQSILQDSVRRSLAQTGSRSGPQMRQTLSELGVLALPFPEEAGGLGGSSADVMLVMQEVGRALVEDAFVPASYFAGTLFAILGIEGEAIASMADGSALSVVAASEPAGRGDPNFVQATVRRDGEGFVLDGTKSVVLGADEARTIIVTATAADGSFEGVGLIKVGREQLGEVVTCRTIDGYSAADIQLDGVRVPSSALIAENCADALAAATDSAIMAACAEAVGAMEAGLWMTRDYLKTRQQFGVVISTFQALQHRMADHYVDLEQARSMLYRGYAALEAPAIERTRTVSAAKAYIGRIGKRFGADMIQLHGGIGVTEEHIIGHYYRRLLAIDARFADCNFHLGRFAGI